MRRLPLFLLLAFLLAACAPVTVVGDSPAAGVVLIQEVEQGYSAFRLTVDPPVTQAVLRFPGADLRTNATECSVTAGSLNCTLGAVQSYYVLAVAGPLTIPADRLLGVACRAADCRPIYLQ